LIKHYHCVFRLSDKSKSNLSYARNTLNPGGSKI